MNIAACENGFVINLDRFNSKGETISWSYVCNSMDEVMKWVEKLMEEARNDLKETA